MTTAAEFRMAGLEYLARVNLDPGEGADMHHSPSDDSVADVQVEGHEVLPLLGPEVGKCLVDIPGARGSRACRARPSSLQFPAAAGQQPKK